MRRAVLIVIVLVVGACSAKHQPTAAPPTSTSVGHSAARSFSNVRLVAANASTRTLCIAAAQSVGFAVPCPSRVPTRAGQPLSCTPLPIPTTLPLCVGLPHDFFMEWTDFDVPSDFVGVDGKPAGHVIIHAALVRNSPPVPCIDAVKLRSVTVGASSAIEYQCPPDSPRIERLAQHGEGAYAGHLTLAWARRGIEYLVSSHGFGDASRNLAEELARSINLVQS